jgi:aspartyl protease family protein
MDVFKWAVVSAVVALVAGQQLSTLDPAKRKAIWASVSGSPRDVATEAVAGAGRTPIVVPPLVVPASAPVGPGDEVIAPDRYGQFQTAVEIDGERLPAMIDTGASFVSLTYEDADRIGIRPATSDFKYAVSTANGRAAVAKVDLPSIRIGSIEVRDVTALVSGRGQLAQSLIGMSFLSRLSGVKVDHGRLLLSR